MRLLFDENLSEALVRTLAAEFPESLHVRPLGLGGAEDTRVWTAAIEHGAVLVTRDGNYRHLRCIAERRRGHRPIRRRGRLRLKQKDGLARG
jgi:predicted nuclease of predicted toxin-antitoxin system